MCVPRTGLWPATDLKTLTILSRVGTGGNPDAILYEAGHKKVYTFDGSGKSATVFDPTTGKVEATIALPGKPEFAVADVEAGRIYGNIEDTSSIVAIDTATYKVVSTWPVAPGEEPSGLAIDVANHRLFTVCSNSKMLMLDSRTGKVLSHTGPTAASRAASATTSRACPGRQLTPP